MSKQDTSDWHHEIMTRRFWPRLLDHLPAYGRESFVADISAGTTVALVALPLAMTIAIASGLPPQAGLTTAIIAGLLISLLGGSSVQIGGPAGAFIVVVYAIVERYGIPNLLLSTLFAGGLIFLMGLFRLGEFVRQIPVSIVAGFTSGIAVLIALSQLREWLGLAGPALPAEFFSKLNAIWLALPSTSLPTLLLGIGSVALIQAWPRLRNQPKTMVGRIASRMPGTLLALLLGTLIVNLFNLPIETVQSRFGEIPHALPTFSLPEFNWATVQFLFAPTLTIALLGATESLFCARVADGLMHERHDPNQELMAQGIANMVAPLFGGLCATGATSRTLTNIRAGARTPISGIVHALSLLLIVLFASSFAEDIPLVSLASTALVVAWNMVDWRTFRELQSYSNSFKTTFLSTFVLTIVMDITVAVQVGLGLAVLLFVRSMVRLTRLERIEEDALQAEGLEVEADTAVYRLSGVLFFGAVSRLDSLMEASPPPARRIVLDLTGLLTVDTTGLEALRTLGEQLGLRGSRLILAAPRPEVLQTMTRQGFVSDFGGSRIMPTLRGALAHRSTLPA